MSEIIGNILENSPVRTAEAPMQGVNQIEQPKIEKIEPNTASEISEGVESPGIVKQSEPVVKKDDKCCLLYTSPIPRDRTRSRMPSSA